MLSLSPDLPIAAVIVDTPARVDAFLPQVQEIVTDGLITVEDVRAIGHVAGKDVTEDVAASASSPGRCGCGEQDATAPGTEDEAAS
jgi:hypothetical protein